MDIQEKVEEAARKGGATRNMIYQWRHRQKIPSEWKTIIFRETAGAISFSDLDNVFKKDEAA